MLDVLWARWKQGYRTMDYPAGPPPQMPERFAGWPVVQQVHCSSGCQACAEVCPTGALELAATAPRVRLDLGRCLFCRACEQTCPHGAIAFSDDYQLAAARREDLIVSEETKERVRAFNEQAHRLFGRSLKLRQVSAGGCNACEADANVLGTVAWDLGRFGIQFAASPRHADGLLITGPVPANMRLALQKTYEALPAPKIVIAVGSCAIAGGPYVGHPEVHDGASGTVPVDLFVPGCPPHPLTILDALLRFLGQVRED